MNQSKLEIIHRWVEKVRYIIIIYVKVFNDSCIAQNKCTVVVGPPYRLVSSTHEFLKAA